MRQNVWWAITGIRGTLQSSIVHYCRMIQLFCVQTTSKPNHFRLYCPLKKSKFCEFGPTFPLLTGYVKGFDGCRYHGQPYLQMFIGGKELNFNQVRQIALVMESADKNVHSIVACSNTTKLTQLNISHIDRGNSSQRNGKKPCFWCDRKHSPDYYCFRMQLATSARKLATFQQPAKKGKVIRAPEIARHIRST